MNVDLFLPWNVDVYFQVEYLLMVFTTAQLQVLLIVLISLIFFDCMGATHHNSNETHKMPLIPYSNFRKERNLHQNIYALLHTFLLHTKHVTFSPKYHHNLIYNAWYLCMLEWRRIFFMVA